MSSKINNITAEDKSVPSTVYTKLSSIDVNGLINNSTIAKHWKIAKDPLKHNDQEITSQSKEGIQQVWKYATTWFAKEKLKNWRGRRRGFWHQWVEIWNSEGTEGNMILEDWLQTNCILQRAARMSWQLNIYPFIAYPIFLVLVNAKKSFFKVQDQSACTIVYPFIFDMLMIYTLKNPIHFEQVISLILIRIQSWHFWACPCFLIQLLISYIENTQKTTLLISPFLNQKWSPHPKPVPPAHCRRRVPDIFELNLSS